MTLARDREKALADLLKAQGYLVERAQNSARFIGPGRVISNRNDLFGCLDVLAVDTTGRFLGYQVTSQGSHDNTGSERRTKVASILGSFIGESFRVRVAAYSTGAGWDWIIWELDPVTKEWVRLGRFERDQLPP